MIWTQCPACNRQFACGAYRIKKERPHPPCCSIRCAWKMLKSLGYKPWDTPERKKRITNAQKLYERSDLTIDKIASRCGVHKGTINKWARDGKWRKFVRITSVRTRYRNAATAMLERKLKPFEQVHHIDGDIENNRPNNLHVYPDAASHSRGHQSLELCALALFERGLIKFVRGTYVLCG